MSSWFLQSGGQFRRALFAVGRLLADSKKGVSLVDPADIYFDLFKRNMDTRRLIILAALGAVLGFGAWLIERDQTKGEMLRPLWQLSSWSWPDYLVLIGLTAAFVVSWSLYFFYVVED
ncbi:hypothetical protein [Mesorhizobium sp. 128a]